MLTNDDIQGFVDLAGPGLTWDGVRGGSRPPSSYRTALRDDLWERQGRTCPVCGKGDTGEGIEFNHVVARGPKVKGFHPGNVFAGHASCNASTKPIYDEAGNLISGVEILWADHFKRVDLIPLEWTPPTILRASR